MEGLLVALPFSRLDRVPVPIMHPCHQPKKDNNASHWFPTSSRACSGHIRSALKRVHVCRCKISPTSF